MDNSDIFVNKRWIFVEISGNLIEKVVRKLVKTDKLQHITRIGIDIMNISLKE